MAAREYEKKTEEFILPILERLGFELWDVEYVKEGKEHYLRAYIDKEGGITINDCVAVSREMNEILDREDYIPEEYIFEVSSPGLDRPLKKDRDFSRSIGKRVEIHTYRALDGQKDFSGELVSYDADRITIKEEETQQVFERKDIAQIRLEVVL
ncbi:MAG: ribosome maturation factor RimP [Lachnospiraceae bacterium]|nr:ribosome maturation factor RimP [Lachnospiraceae bacterium]MBQ2577459.1 ribosome maturation factor RimP [Lachnospiraceae bacterium]MCR4731915.1 ribosome maturation factor RimP [Lachnospiraceae bacterium]MEE3354746.1 ribosome maturation factor RimP [Candidatus Weimeria sp.]